MVATKAFLISIIMMPVLILGSLFATSLLQNLGEIKERKIAVIDHSGSLFPLMEQLAEKRNEIVQKAIENADGDKKSERLPGFSQEKYVLEKVDSKQVDDDFRLQLSDRIRKQELYAFVEIPAPILAGQGSSTESAVRFFSPDSSLSEARRWFRDSLNVLVRSDRLKKANIDPQVVVEASTPVAVTGMQLLERSADGTVQANEESGAMTAMILPMAVMLLMFMVIFMSAQPMLESVLEEKSQRIAEVLLGSANPFQLMSGKLFGTVAGSLTVFGIYLVGAYSFAIYRDYTSQIPFEIVPWFVAFQVVGVLFYSSIFLAIGASVSQLKEAQAVLLPVWMIMMSPMFVWIFIVREPLGTMATGISFFPPATPTAMMLRMATGQSIPLWQPLVALVLTSIATMMIVYLAARIFRVGILWQGKTPKISEILRWALTG